MPKVSNLTKVFVKKILSNKSPGLVKLIDCLELHQPVIKSLCENLSVKDNKNIYDCKITYWKKYLKLKIESLILKTPYLFVK